MLLQYDEREYDEIEREPVEPDYSYDDLKNEVCSLIEKKVVTAGNEIPLNYDDRLSDGQVAEFFRDLEPEETPRSRFEAFLNESAWTYMDYMSESAVDELRSHLSPYGVEYLDWKDRKDSWSGEEELKDLFYSFFDYYYPEGAFDREVCVNIRLDTGNGNYDFTKDDPFGVYSDGVLPEESSLRFLARTQGHEQELADAVKEEYLYRKGKGEKPEIKNRFVQTCIDEMDNLGSCMQTTTLLVKTSLYKLFDLWDDVHNGTGAIVVSKDARCGLECYWEGGGSLLEVELEKDVEIPVKQVFEIVPDGVHRWDIHEVYGVTDRFWKGTVRRKGDK